VSGSGVNGLASAISSDASGEVTVVDGELARLVADAVAAKSSTGAAHAAAKAILARGRSS
jgi:hypothetical protein